MNSFLFGIEFPRLTAALAFGAHAVIVLATTS
jgi:hypothetical protein